MAPHIETKDIIGYWGKPTSTLDWCEKNYVVNYYMAEFWNTITNLSMIITPIYGLISAYQQGIERRYMICYALLLLTGIGSWMFHMTLLFEMQLMDEVPMVWGGAFMLYSLYRARNSYEEGGKWVGISLLLYSIVVTVAYLFNKNAVFHEFMYGVLVTGIVLLAVKYNYLHYKKATSPLFYSGLVLYGVGFFLWNIDNNFCPQITDVRENTLGSNTALRFLSPLTQLHGWWHLMAGYATYVHIINCIQHRLTFLGIEHSIEPSWIGVSLKIDPTQQRKLLKSTNYQD